MPTDDARVVLDLMNKIRSQLARLIERSPLVPVAQEDQRTWFFLATIQVGVIICVPMFALGGELGRHARFVDLSPAVIVGSLIVACLASLTGLVGRITRVPTAVIMRRAFGSAGGKIVAVILVITLFGWFGVQTEMLVHSIRMLLEGNAGFTVPRLPVTLACGALMSSTAIIGFRALGKIAYVAVPLLLAVIAVPTWIALTTHDVLPLLVAPAAETPFSFGLIVSIISGGFMVGITIAPDLTRFLRSSNDMVIGTFVSLGLGLPVLLLLSTLLGLVYGSGDLIRVLSVAGVGAPALFVIILATWTSNDKNLYEASLSLAAVLPGRERWQLTALAGVVGTAMAVGGIFEHFIDLLIFMGITIAPVAGVYLVDCLVNRALYLPTDAARIESPGIRWRSFVAWLGGIALGLLTLPVSSHGLGYLHLTSVPTIDAMLAAAGIHWTLCQLSAQKRTIPLRS